VRVSTHRQNGLAILKVADTGPGICKTLAEAHGGQLRVESIVNEGTTFELLLPG
jgi:signal transduction histidine kinase